MRGNYLRLNQSAGDWVYIHCRYTCFAFGVGRAYRPIYCYRLSFGWDAARPDYTRYLELIQHSSGDNHRNWIGDWIDGGRTDDHSKLRGNYLFTSGIDGGATAIGFHSSNSCKPISGVWIHGSILRDRHFF